MSDDRAQRRIYLVDGTAQVFRAYFALGPMTTDDGLPTNAIYGFTSMLRKLIADEEPRYLAVAFDPAGPVFRNEAYADYKANRPPIPEDLVAQFPYTKKVCEVLGVPVLEREGFEADDVIATLTERARQEGFEVVVVASDKDLLQLVGEGVTVFDPVKERRLDPAGVVESFGVPPEHVLDVLGLMGDSVDNIPGVPGVGRKTALSSVNTYGDTEAVIDRAERFTAAYDARDTMVAALDAASQDVELTEASVGGVREAAASLEPALLRLIEAEKDAALRERYEAYAELLRAADLDAFALEVGQPGRRATKSLAALKRESKALDRGSAKRVWYSIRDNVEQARLSRRLATLHREVPLPLEPSELVAADPDRAAARALFSALGFRRLTKEFGEGDSTVDLGASDEATVGRRTALAAKDLEALAASYGERPPVAISALAGGGDPLREPLVGLGLAAADHEAAYVPVGHAYLGAPGQVDVESIRAHLGPLLSDPRTSRVGHDVKREMHLLRGCGVSASGWQLDTMVAAFLLNPGRASYGLSRVVAQYLGTETTSTADLLGSGAKRREARQLEIDGAARFACERAEATLRLARELSGRLEDAGLAELYRTIDGPLIPLLARMEAHGIRIDTGLLESMSVEMAVELDGLRTTIHELAGGEFNLDSPKQMREVLFEKLGLKPGRKTAKSKAASTDAQTLEDLAGEHEIAGAILEYRGLAKLKSTYVDSLPRLVDPATGRVHTHYDPTGAATGRLSSSDPNLQNIPVRTPSGRKIRRAFVPDDGFVFLASDYSQIELRVLAHLTGDPGLIAAFRAGEDVHRHTASQVFGVLPDLVTDEMRRRAKAINFGLLYGMSETRLAREQGMKRTEARRFVQAYFERFGRVRDYIEEVREQARREGAVRTLFGRVRYFPQLHEKVNRGIQEQALRGAVNTTVQGTAADLMKLAMLRVDEALTRAASGARMLLQVHDELLLEVPQGAEQEVGRIVREAMEGVHPLEVPLVVDQKVGPNWMDAA
jgi:DNA polymerase-1